MVNVKYLTWQVSSPGFCLNMKLRNKFGSLSTFKQLIT